MKISEYFDLEKTQYELDFVDIDTDKDMCLFLDPYFISKQEFPLAEEAYKSLKCFFELLLQLLKQGKVDAAGELFAHLGESNEICLGMSKGIPSGHGMGPLDAEKIFKSLVKSQAFVTGLMEDIEDCRIFVPNVDKDKVSDMTANIIRKQLIEYTQEQCNLLGIPMVNGVSSGWYWDYRKKSWESQYTEMLVINDKKVILVPKRIVSFSKMYTSERYFNNYVLAFLQNEQLKLNSPLVRTRKDNSQYVTKKDIKASISMDKHIDKDWLVAFTKKHPEVFKEFKKETIKEITPINNEGLADVELSEVIDFLKNKLIAIPCGNDNATEYHRTILGIMELLFYPFLSRPKREAEIHDGRKRIDITFDNCAETGFFKRLHDTLPCNFIMVECKNYKSDISNPELDQLSGRFSDHRGKFGISACRHIDDIDLFIKRCSDTYKDGRGLVIPLIDDDFISMLETFETSGSEGWESILQDRFHTISMT